MVEEKNVDWAREKAAALGVLRDNSELSPDIPPTMILFYRGCEPFL